MSCDTISSGGLSGGTYVSYYGMVDEVYVGFLYEEVLYGVYGCVGEGDDGVGIYVPNVFNLMMFCWGI